jgi:hypothetical protein
MLRPKAFIRAARISPLPVTRFLEEKLKLRVNREKERRRSGRGTQVSRPLAAVERETRDLTQKREPRQGKDQADYRPESGR